MNLYPDILALNCNQSSQTCQFFHRPYYFHCRCDNVVLLQHDQYIQASCSGLSGHSGLVSVKRVLQLDSHNNSHITSAVFIRAREMSSWILHPALDMLLQSVFRMPTH